ncbi:MAG: YggS family pyridoxal phosphate-dependent enzyme [bacterium]
MYKYIEQNIKNVRARVAVAAKKAGRQESDIAIVAVAKTFPSAAIKAAVGYGLGDIGESRVQEAEQKIKELGQVARWHLVGHLQTNKAAKAVKMFDMIQSVDSLKLAEAMNRAAESEGKKIDCLVEINSSGELSKFGVRPSDAERLIEDILELRYISLRGLMTVGPLTESEPVLRASFRLTRKILEQGQALAGEKFHILSMGMSGDFETAIEEGSNMIRLGSALFGERKR